jgi:transcriptional regulator with XRE-family HTH domain
MTVRNKRFHHQAVHRPERDRNIFKILRAIKGMKSGDVANKTYVAQSTIQNWRTGKTRYPQSHTLSAVAEVAGLKFDLVQIDAKERVSDAPMEFEETKKRPAPKKVEQNATTQKGKASKRGRQANVKSQTVRP